PWRMAGFSRRWVERRAVGMAIVLSNAGRPALEFDDATNASELLAGLSKAPEAIYAVVRRGNGSVLASWHPELAPAMPRGSLPSDGLPMHEEPTVTFGDSQVHVQASIRAKAGATGMLSLGFSLRELDAETRSNQLVAAAISTLVFLIGVA